MSKEIEIIQIFNQIAGIVCIKHKDFPEGLTVELQIVGKYIPSENILILTSNCGSFERYYPEEVKMQFNTKTIYLESLSDAARRCVKFADRSFIDLKKLFNPEVESTQKQSNGGPYR